MKFCAFDFCWGCFVILIEVLGFARLKKRFEFISLDNACNWLQIKQVQRASGVIQDLGIEKIFEVIE